MPIYEPGLADLVKRNAQRLHFTTDIREVTERASIVFVCVNTPPMYSGDADLSFVEAVIDELPADTGDVVLAMKSTVPGRHRRAPAATARRARPRPRALRLQPRVPQGGRRDPATSCTRTAWSSAATTSGRSIAWSQLHAPLESRDRAHRRRHRRDDQGRVQRVPRHQDQLHQRDRQRLRGDRRRRHRGRRGHGHGQAHRPALPARRHRLRRLLLRQGRLGAQAARRQHRVPLPAAQRGDRGQRAAEAAPRRQALQAPGPPARQADRAARAGVQAGHRRHARGGVARDRVAAARRGRGGARPRSRRQRGRPPDAARRRDPRRPDVDARGRRRGGADHRVARVRRARPRARAPRRCARRCWWTAATSSRRSRRPAPV